MVSSGLLAVGHGNFFESNQGTKNGASGVLGFGTSLTTNGRNDGTGNGAVNCQIIGHTPTGGGRYC